MKTAIDAEHAPIRGHGRVVANDVDGNGRKRRLAVPNWPGAIPGQFLMVGAGAESGVPRLDPLLPRPMAVYRDLGSGSSAGPGVGGEDASGDPQIELLYRVVGRGTTLLAAAQPGQTVSVVGPLGRGFPLSIEPEAPMGQ